MPGLQPAAPRSVYAQRQGRLREGPDIPHTHFVIVGNGVAGIEAAFTIRERDPSAEITVISGESPYYFSRTALMYALMDRLSRQDLEPFERRVYDRQRIQRRHSWVTGLDAERQLVSCDNGETLNYDRLLLATGSRPNVPAWPGLNEVTDGFTYFVSMQDLDRAERLATNARRAVVVGGGLIGVELVECLVHFGIPVDYLIREPYYWPAALEAAEAALVTEHLQRHGVNVMVDEEVAAVLHRNGRLTGLRTVKGTQMNCDFLGICIGVHPAMEWLTGVATPPETGRGIRVDTRFRTSLPAVFAAGDCAEIVLPDGTSLVEQIWYAAKRQGRLAGRAMLGDAIDYRPPLFFNSAKFFRLEYTTVGVVTPLPAGARSFFFRHPSREATIRLVEQQGRLIGANFLGSRWDHTVLERWIEERRSLDYAACHLRAAQFDVEFGGLDLRPFEAAYRAFRQSEAA